MKIFPRQLALAIAISFVFFAGRAFPTWEIQTCPTSQTLTSVCFISPKSGWVVGDSGIILHTNNAGRTWATQLETGANLKSVYFLDSLNGWAAGTPPLPAYSYVYHTSNGGKTWESQFIGYGVRCFSIFFPDDSHGWIAGMDESSAMWYGETGTIRYWTNDGQGWRTQPHQGGFPLHSVFFLNAQVGWAAGEQGELLYTPDQGKTWSALQCDTIGSMAGLNSIQFANADTGWATGYDYRVILTIDGGRHWERHNIQSCMCTSLYPKLHFVDAKNGWVLSDCGTGCNFLFRTRNGGISWDTVDLGLNLPRRNTYDVYFTDTANGWVALDSGTILHYFSLDLNSSNFNKIADRKAHQGLSIAYEKATNRIEFSTPVPDRAILRIYDAQGRLLATPFNENVAAGRHIAFYSFIQCNPGILFLNLSSGEHSITKPLFSERFK
jgi:photosystem II stability/assembly factor-like uncharacterized protein